MKRRTSRRHEFEDSSRFTSLMGFVLLTGTRWLSMGAARVYVNVVKAIQVSRPVA